MTLNGKLSKTSLTANGFGLAQLYQFPATDILSGYVSAPVSAQPLYITNVTTNVGGSNHCNTPPGCNLLIAATLDDLVYAFDTSQTAGTVTPLWSANIIGGTTQKENSHCMAGGLPFANGYGGQPGGSTLAYYGAVATPVIDVNTTLTGGDPIVHVVSACVASGQTNAKKIQWFLDAIDLTNGNTIGTVQIMDQTTGPPAQTFFNSAYELSRASLLITHPDTGSFLSAAALGTYIYVAFGAGAAEVGAENGASETYSGALFAFSVTYSGSGTNATATYSYLPTRPSPSNYTANFYTECVNGTQQNPCPSSNLYPATTLYPTADCNGYGTQGAGGGPASWAVPNTACSAMCSNPPNSNCSPGANWGISGGGMWGGSGIGPASNAEAQVYANSGNGAFACTVDGTSQCTSVGNVKYFGESAIEFPSGVNPNVAGGSYTGTVTASNSGWCAITMAGGSPYIAAIGIVQMVNGVAQRSTYFIYQGGASYMSTPMMATVGDLPFIDTNYPAASGCSGTVTPTNTLNSLAALSPTDFYTPYVNTYTANFPNNDGNTTDVLLMPQELSRLDLDFGVCGPVMVTTSAGLFMYTCDKVSNLYVMPTPEIPGVSLGTFQQNDKGLSGGTIVGNNIYKTEAPFQISRSGESCETIDLSGASNGQISGNCDEAHVMPWFNNLAAAWPSNETVELFQGALITTHPNGGTTYQYTFGTGPAYDPCNTSGNCNVPNPPFPPAAAMGGLMAIAASNQQPPATLWSVVPLNTGGMAIGSLYGYSIDFTGPSLSKIWQWNNNGTVCPSHTGYTRPPVSGWFTPSFTEPTLADGWKTGTSATGAVYIPTVCVVNNPGHTPYKNCAAAAADNAVQSGIPVFTNCP